MSEPFFSLTLFINLYISFANLQAIIFECRDSEVDINKKIYEIIIDLSVFYFFSNLKTKQRGW